MSPRLCVSLEAPTTAALCARRDAVDPAVDLVELRLDSVADPDVGRVLAGRGRPVVVTCRPTWEGGRFTGSEEERRRLLTQAVDAGADYVDVEWRAGFDDLVRRRGGQGIVLSMHDFEGVPADLAARYRAMRATGAEVVKLAVRARRLCDTLPLLELGRAAAAEEAVALIGMGPAGQPSRILAARFGSCWCYAGDQVAPGQIAAERMLGEFRFKMVSADSAVYGVLGAPIAHSVSPAMHNAAFAAERIDAVYVPLEAQDIDDFATFAAAVGLAGASVTAPFKLDVFDRLDEVDPLGQRVGAVNTLRVYDGRWFGMNSDVPGFLEPLRARLDLAGRRATVLGAGGAARAVAVGLSSAGARVTISARNRARALRVAALVGGTVAAMPPPRGSWDILVNATPIGTAPRSDETPLEAARLDGHLVFDLVYNPIQTRLLTDAQAAGCETLGGLAMLVAQARRQFEWWTGRRPAEAVLRAAAQARLGSTHPDATGDRTP